VPPLGKGSYPACPLLAVPSDILENILQVPLSSPGIKVLSMTKEEQHKRKVEQLMEFL
jgi:hypothetical protein